MSGWNNQKRYIGYLMNHIMNISRQSLFCFIDMIHSNFPKRVIKILRGIPSNIAKI